MIRKSGLSWRGPPLALQILGLLLGGLVVAQLVTLFLTMLLPPAPKPQYGLDDIAAALADRAPGSASGLQRVVQAGPPDVGGPGWLMSDRSRRDLARLLNVAEPRVSLAFYTPLPFAGTATARPTLAMANDGPVAPAFGAGAFRPVALTMMLDAPPGGMPPGMGGGGMPMTLPPSAGPPPRDSFPPGTFLGGGPGNGPGGGFGGGPGFARPPPAGSRGNGGQGPLIGTAPPAQAPGIYIPGDGGAAVPPLLRGGVAPPAGAQPGSAPSGSIPPNVAQGAAGQRLGPPPALAGPPGAPLPRIAAPDQAIVARTLPAIPPRSAPPLLVPDRALPPQRQRPAPPAEAARTLPLPSPSATDIPERRTPEVAAAPEAAAVAPPSGPPIRIAPVQRSLFGFAPAPFVEGDFVAALQLPDGRWAVVQPAAEPFPNSWQRRVLLWFAISLALVAPFGWLFAQRLVKPLRRFAGAAEQLGRDPSTTIGPLDGPAEIGRAAHAFNLMQNRLRTFVDDRTAMVGAISHDLRTPLTRMRFRLEDVQGEAREGLLEEVDEMEAMIAQVIDFIRDASTPGARERLDLRTLVDDVVEDARMVGGDVVIEQAEPAPVEIDVLGMRRLLDNLLENAVKYGDRARVRLTTEADTAIAEIIDDGPGLDEDEIERVFEPFYRSVSARASDKAGSGLGLAVCRSIARAHGGEVRLLRAGDGFRAEVRVPLAFGAEPSLAA